jgi:hypothetical protein
VEGFCGNTTNFCLGEGVNALNIIPSDGQRKTVFVSDPSTSLADPGLDASPGRMEGYGDPTNHGARFSAIDRVILATVCFASFVVVVATHNMLWAEL